MKTFSQLSFLKTSAAPLALGFALVAAPAGAQTRDPGQQIPGQIPEGGVSDGPEASTGPSDAIVVTGSRIISPNIESVQPVQTIDDEQIDISGATNIQEVLLENPAFGTPGLSRTNTAFLTSGTGVATVDLRDLGSDRTLVLINSRRVVSGLPGSATVDLNVIPTQFIERVDVLTGGASSLYGSDAVAGVVNFIYKRNFEGLLAEGQIGITEQGDSFKYQTSVTAGINDGDGRGNIMVHLGYSNEDGLFSRDRRNTRVDDADRFAFGFSDDPADFGTPQEPFFSGFAPQGSFTAGGSNFTFDANNNLIAGFSTNGAPGVAPNGFNRQAFRTLAVPVERYLFAARGHYDITDNLSFIAEGTFAKTDASREIEPFPLGSDDIFPDSGGLVPIETPVLTPVPGSPGTFTRTVVLNPFVPAAIAAAATDRDGDGLRDISFARRLAEVGARNGSTSRDFYRFVVGVEGSLFDDRFNFDVTYNYGQTVENQTSNGQVNVSSFRNALQAIPDPVNPGGVICANADARAEGCVPVNVFGFGSITPAALAYIDAEQTFQTDIKQQVVQANLSGTLIELPGGPLGIAVGAEYRKEESVENNDALTNDGLNAGNALPDTQGQFDVKEVYGEVNIPILADRPFFHALNLRGAGRISDYSTIGTVYSYSAGAEYAPIPEVRFRGTYARAVRAPNIGELFTGPSQTFPTGLQDPCVGIGATGGGTLGDQCRSFGGVLANINANGGAFTLNQSDLQGISGFDSGNPNLEEEKADSYTAGVVINPSTVGFLRGTVLSVDYFNIDIEDAIVSVPRQFILDQCFRQAEQSFCNFITRRPGATATNSPGSIEFINSGGVNGGRLKVEGIDTVLSYSTRLDRLGLDGKLFGRVAYTHYFDGFVVPVPGSDPDPFVGEIGTSDDRFTSTLGYTGNNFRVSFTGTYIGPASEDDLFLASFELEPGAIGVGSEFYLDTQVSFTASDELEVYFGADNLLDNNAPNLLSGTTFNTTGSDTAADVYDIFGRRFYAGVRLRF